MRKQIFTLAIVLTFFVNGISTIVFADTKTNRQVNQINQLAALLPASDGVLTLDVQRLLSEAVPQILSGKPQMLADINDKIDEIKTQTGFDLRQFEQVVIGVSTKQISPKEFDLESVVLARGKYSAGALIALAKIASKGKYREEKIGSRAVYVFSGKDIAEQNKSQTKNSWFGKAIDRMIGGLSKEVAVASLTTTR